jgi:hypothetical protein
MQFNRGTYNKHEETRVLKEIKSLKDGKEKLKEFEEKKKLESELVNKLDKLKGQREENKNNYQILNEKKSKLKDSLNIKFNFINHIKLGKLLAIRASQSDYN